MSEKTTIEILKQNKWTPQKDEVGDTVLELNLCDRILIIIPSIRKFQLHYTADFIPSTSTEKFRDIARQIRQQKKLIAPLALMKFRTREISEISEATIIPITNEIIEWARSVDINSEIIRHAQLPTNTWGAMPLRHLAALALLGDTEKLEFYKKSFESGDRLGFATYISIEMIERTLEIAQTNSARLPR
ncbi:DUF6990 domain-containing protein [Pandoraea sp. NPDC087047]|uniref:DUF6990 domain-containing protein n=1 Tax=Pandoraea sp. NPDC087047 TaxID=3364390 RepID=UPI00380EFD2A